MNIKRAKEEIEHTVKAYLAKDALGGVNRISTVYHRPHARIIADFVNEVKDT